MNKLVKVGVGVNEKTFNVDDNYAALTEAIKELTKEIRKLRNGR